MYSVSDNLPSFSEMGYHKASVYKHHIILYLVDQDALTCGLYRRYTSEFLVATHQIIKLKESRFPVCKGKRLYSCQKFLSVRNLRNAS
jgi:hypothetical protein